MATQGATLQRRGVHVPVLLVAALVALALATAITGIVVNLTDDVRPAPPVASVQEFDGTGPRGATLDAVRDARAIQAWETAMSELPTGPFHAKGRAHEVEVLADVEPIVNHGDCVHCQQQR
jgi:hypothetical protein